MSAKKPLYQMPVPSTELVPGAGMCGNTLRFEYSRDGAVYRGGIRFNRVLAVRSRAERCCTAWHIEGAFDTLVEVDNSAWVEEILADIAERWRNAWETHHYMIYLDSAGCFEIIAASWDVLPEEPGSWSPS